MEAYLVCGTKRHLLRGGWRGLKTSRNREILSNASDAIDKYRFLSLTDRRIQGGKPVTATFMYASLMWPSFISEFNRLRKAARDSSKGGKSPAQCAEDAMNTVIGEQCRHTAARTYYNTTPDSLTLDQCATDGSKIRF